jgi:hypothetical protein
LKTAKERLSAARASAKTVGKQIEVFEEARRTALLIDDDASAERADAQLAPLRRAAQRAADKIALLEPLVEAEREQAWPDDLDSARARLQEMQDRHAALQRKPVVDRSAADQAEIDGLVCHIPVMRNHIALLERMAA